MLKYDVIPISEVERKHNGHWFDADSKRFFNSRWDSYALRNPDSIYAYFVSSEKCEYADPRTYTIRRVNMRTGNFGSSSDGSIFEFRKFETKAKAYKALKAYLESEPIKADKVEFLVYAIKDLQYREKRIDPEIQELVNELAKITES